MYSDSARFHNFRSGLQMLSPHPRGYHMDAFLTAPYTAISIFHDWSAWVFPTNYPCRQCPGAPTLGRAYAHHLQPTAKAIQGAAVNRYMKLLEANTHFSNDPASPHYRHITRMIDHIRLTRGSDAAVKALSWALELAACIAEKEGNVVPLKTLAHWMAATDGTEVDPRHPYLYAVLKALSQLAACKEFG